MIGAVSGTALLVLAVVAFPASSEVAPERAGDDPGRVLIKADVDTARAQAKGIRGLTGYPADAGRCGNEVLGPLPEGMYTGEEAWLKLIAPVCAVVRRKDERTGQMRNFADMSRCKCSFGLARFWPLQEEHVLVAASSMPELGDHIPSPTTVLGRKEIEATGAASIPDLLRYFSQTSFQRGSGYRPSGAEYAELRGLGAAYTLVLLNGRRTFGTAADLASSAFDLSVIPISAVERIEISLDSSSLVYGTDAIGGIINVVLSERVEPAYEVRYGQLPGGPSLGHASISGGSRGERGRFAIFLDAEGREELLGRERDRWRNQNYQRFGGQDYRSTLASPFNVSSLDGRALPGLPTSSAVAEYNPQTGAFDFVTGEKSLTSLRSYQSIVPSGSRQTLSANGTMRLGSIVASAEALAVRRESEFQTLPPIIPGYTWGKDHPENTLGVPVRVEALLAGLPPQRQRAETESRRLVLAAEGRLAGWDLSSFVVLADEWAKVESRNRTNPKAIADALLFSADVDDDAEPRLPLSLDRTVLPGEVPAGIVVPPLVERYSDSAGQMQLAARGTLLSLPAGGVTLKAGVEYRQESMEFDPRVPTTRRDIYSGFTQLQVPVIEDLKLILGARRDEYSDIGRVTKSQVGLVWRVTDSISAHASASESFRPPSLVELHVPRVTVPALILDPKLNQLSAIELITGGNPALRPTSGQSQSVGVSFQPNDRWRFSTDYWRVKAKGHVSLFAPISLLAHEDEVLPGRIVRDESTGRLLQLDISRANVGGAKTEGLDVAIDGAISTPIGVFLPALSMTFTNKFLYGDLPVTDAGLEDRVGIASELGTIPRYRGVLSLTYQRNDWRATTHARLISPYRDRDPLTGAPMARRVSSGPIWDLNVSKEFEGNIRVMVGAFNVMNQEPPFANIGGSLGFDTSQGDLEGRELYVRLTGAF